MIWQKKAENNFNIRKKLTHKSAVYQRLTGSYFQLFNCIKELKKLNDSSVSEAD